MSATRKVAGGTFRLEIATPLSLSSAPTNRARWDCVGFNTHGLNDDREYAVRVKNVGTVKPQETRLPVATEVWVMQPASDVVAVNAASFAAGTPVAPGSVVSLFGKITGSQTAPATSYPLPRKLGETEVLVVMLPVRVPVVLRSPGLVRHSRAELPRKD